MKKAQEHYKTRIAVLGEEIVDLKKRIGILITLRLIMFLVFGLGIWGLMNWSPNLLWAAVTLGAAVGFMISLKKHGQKKVEQDVAKQRRKIAKAELSSLDGSYSFSFEGREYQQVDHDFTHDLDLFGPRSLFQAISRGGLKSSRNQLATMLSTISHGAEEIRMRQEAITELSTEPELREEVQALTSLAHEGELDETKLLTWCKTTLLNPPKSWMRIFFILIPLYQAVNVGLYALNYTAETAFVFFLLLPLCLTLARVAKTKADHTEIDTQYKELSKLTAAIKKLESTNWSSELLKEKQRDLRSGRIALSDLQKILSRFDDRNNFIVVLLGNVFFVWDLWCSKQLHDWHGEHAGEVDHSLQSLFEFEALSSFAAFNFNLQEHLTVATLDAQMGVKAKGLRHPLMKFESCVDNDLEIGKGEIKIVTGANMAGKSTFLRTVGLNFVLAMNGSKVCSDIFSFTPTTLYTSMRTSDSLLDQESYFFNELKRLHVLVEKLEAGERPFILLDEILKGTNSKDKAEGSFKFVEKLVTFDSTAIIATHDLSLCTLADVHPDLIENLFFDVEIKEDDLAFDYRVRKGVCSNMNATFLMRKMGITD